MTFFQCLTPWTGFVRQRQQTSTTMNTPATITKEQRDQFVSREDKLRAWMKSNKRNSYKQEELPKECLPTLTNVERAQVELFDFIHDPPTKYLTYHAASGSSIQGCKTLTSGDRLTIWTGLPLGTITSTGRAFTSNMGDLRQSFTARCVNGKVYHGTAYLSAGDYVRMAAAKA